MIYNNTGWWFSTPLKNMKVSWEYEIPNIWKNKKMFQTTNQNRYTMTIRRITYVIILLYKKIKHCMYTYIKLCMYKYVCTYLLYYKYISIYIINIVYIALYSPMYLYNGQWIFMFNGFHPLFWWFMLRPSWVEIYIMDLFQEFTGNCASELKLWGVL